VSLAEHQADRDLVSTLSTMIAYLAQETMLTRAETEAAAELLKRHGKLKDAAICEARIRSGSFSDRREA
jgi:hypothetical protein